MDVDLCQNSLKRALRGKHFTVCKFNLGLNYCFELKEWGEEAGDCVKEGAV